MINFSIYLKHRGVPGEMMAMNVFLVERFLLADHLLSREKSAGDFVFVTKINLTGF